MTLATKKLADAIHGAGIFNRYDEDRGSDPTSCAERNLIGRTHYVDPATRRYHKSRISKAIVLHDGLIFAIMESCAGDYNNTYRVHRPVFFDLDGSVINRVTLEDAPRTSKSGLALFWRMADDIEPIAETRAMLERRAARLTREAAEFAAILSL